MPILPVSAGLFLIFIFCCRFLADGFSVSINAKTGETFAADYDANKPMTAKVFKTIADPFIGKFSLVKVCSGILKSDDTIYNVDKETEEKLSRLYILRGKEQIEVKELYAGDIGVRNRPAKNIFRKLIGLFHIC